MKALYWLAVVIVSLLIVIGVLLLLQSRDDSSLDSGAAGTPVYAVLSASA